MNAVESIHARLKHIHAIALDDLHDAPPSVLETISALFGRLDATTAAYNVEQQTCADKVGTVV